jgi:hypothetical protein
MKLSYNAVCRQRDDGYDFNPRVVNPPVEEFNRDWMNTFLRIIKLKTKVYISNLSKKTKILL